MTAAGIVVASCPVITILITTPATRAAAVVFASVRCACATMLAWHVIAASALITGVTAEAVVAGARVIPPSGRALAVRPARITVAASRMVAVRVAPACLALTRVTATIVGRALLAVTAARIFVAAGVIRTGLAGPAVSALARVLPAVWRAGAAIFAWARQTPSRLVA